MQHLTVLASLDLHGAVAHRLDPASTISCEDREQLVNRLVELVCDLPMQPRTLDLVGLTGHDKLLAFAGRPLDTEIPLVRSVFRELAEQQVLSRLGITAIRLIGCMTAVGERARRTIATLADIVELEVSGTTDLVSVADISSTGYLPPGPHAWPTHGIWLDLDAISPAPPAADARVLARTEGRNVLAQICRRVGVALPPLLALPFAQLALPSPSADRFHHLEVLLDCELIRATVRGESVVYPVDDPPALRMLLER
jgi:hypothetical protein